MDLYRENILDHYKHPRNFGTLKKRDVQAEGSNATCGDSIRIDITYGEKKKKDSDTHIADIKFSGVGCAISQAAASMLTERVMGKSKKQVLEMKGDDMVKLIGSPLTPSRIRCATLALEVIQKALLQ